MSPKDGRHEIDARSGRPLDGGREALEALSDDELEKELTVAAYAPGLLRINRYQRLLGERQRRRPVFT
jgi:hypothetical protein